MVGFSIVCKIIGFTIMVNRSTKQIGINNKIYSLSRSLGFDDFGTQIQLSKSLTSGYISDFNGTISFTKTECTYQKKKYIINNLPKCNKALELFFGVYIEQSYTAPVDFVLKSVSDLFRNQFQITFNWVRPQSTQLNCDKNLMEILTAFNPKANSINVLFTNCTSNNQIGVNGISFQGGYGKPRNGIVLHANRNIIGTMAHEIGHMFNLRHMFEGMMMSSGTRMAEGIRQFSQNSVDELCNFLYI